jgi:molybdopterin synthase sulfur carrier subunit
MKSEEDSKTNITMRFFGVFRRIAGKNKLTIEFKYSVPLNDVIKGIVREMPSLEPILIDPDLEDPRPNTLILVNEREISILDGLETMLEDGDEISFIPILHSG